MQDGYRKRHEWQLSRVNLPVLCNKWYMEIIFVNELTRTMTYNNQIMTYAETVQMVPKETKLCQLR